MNDARLYLNSLEDDEFSHTRECQILRSITLSNGKDALIVRVDPPVIGQYFDQGTDVSVFALVARSEGQSVTHIRHYPCSVHIAKLRRSDRLYTNDPPINVSDLYVVAWGDLYRTRDDAETHRF